MSAGWHIEGRGGVFGLGIGLFARVLVCRSFGLCLCVSDGWHIGGWSGVNGVGIGLFVGFWIAARVVAVVMCAWWLAHLGAARRMPRYGGVVRI